MRAGTRANVLGPRGHLLPRGRGRPLCQLAWVGGGGRPGPSWLVARPLCRGRLSRPALRVTNGCWSSFTQSLPSSPGRPLDHPDSTRLSPGGMAPGRFSSRGSRSTVSPEQRCVPRTVLRPTEPGAGDPPGIPQLARGLGPPWPLPGPRSSRRRPESSWVGSGGQRTSLASSGCRVGRVARRLCLFVVLMWSRDSCELSGQRARVPHWARPESGKGRAWGGLPRAPCCCGFPTAVPHRPGSLPRGSRKHAHLSFSWMATARSPGT